MKTDDRMTPVEVYRERRRRVLAALVLVALFLVGTFVFWHYFAEVPEDYSAIDEHFKYGSIGSDSEAGIPYWIWQVLPEVFPKHLPDPQAFDDLPAKEQTGLSGYKQFGFLVEEGQDLPIGFSKRRVGVDRIGLNCAVCHVSTIRVTDELNPSALYDTEPTYLSTSKERALILGMPANTVDLQSYFEFLLDSAADARFTAYNIMPYIEARTDLGLIERFIYTRAVSLLRDSLLERRQQLRFLEQVPRFGPGRVDTFNPYKTILFGFPYDGTIGTADLPSLWNQRPREGMQLHWDGNNTSVLERNISAALGAGATPVTLDIPRMLRVADWIGSPDPTRKLNEHEQHRLIEDARADPFPHEGELQIPRYPFSIDQAKAKRGKSLFQEHCASCHGWQGTQVGKVVHLSALGTDPKRLESFTEDLAANQNTLGAGHWWRFHNFRTTQGYANMPLDGVWARAPYLHNGSVPTLMALLRAPQRRPKTFYRGDDEYDPVNVGFRHDRSVAADGRKLFLFDTSLPGNDNDGHRYGTRLPKKDKTALLEYLKTIGAGK